MADLLTRFTKAVTALVNPGDPVLVESPVYAYVHDFFYILRHLGMCFANSTPIKCFSGVIPMFQTLRCDKIGTVALLAPFFMLRRFLIRRLVFFFFDRGEYGRVWNLGESSTIHLGKLACR